MRSIKPPEGTKLVTCSFCVGYVIRRRGVASNDDAKARTLTEPVHGVILKRSMCLFGLLNVRGVIIHKFYAKMGDNPPPQNLFHMLGFICYIFSPVTVFRMPSRRGGTSSLYPCLSVAVHHVYQSISFCSLCVYQGKYY